MILETGTVICWGGYRSMVYFGQVIDYTLEGDLIVQEMYRMMKTQPEHHWIYTFKQIRVKQSAYWVIPFKKEVIHNPEDSMLLKMTDPLCKHH